MPSDLSSASSNRRIVTEFWHSKLEDIPISYLKRNQEREYPISLF